MEELPVEMVMQILSHASPTDLALWWGALWRSWNRIANDDRLWMRHQHPKWRTVMGNMGIDTNTTSHRQCFRLLLRHDPKEKREGCCRHDLTKGAVKGTYHEETLADTYDANAATYNSMVTSADVDVAGDFHRDQCLTICSLQDRGLLKERKTFNNDDDDDDDKTHCALRPPLFDIFTGLNRVCYTYAQLYMF